MRSPPTTEGREVEVTLTPGGPALVRGADAIRDEDGTRHPTRRPRVAVCMCGMSRIKPWCDSTHKFVPEET
ncbi:MAG TPA: CDGSH iron-sulfur domain-containing protein [Marmoricola sp.]|jgi:CDGSH-type Zn-finger protein|nr:CDGSH iron-sulfur domain-containing protein [Marmoricola sp.]